MTWKASRRDLLGVGMAGLAIAGVARAGETQPGKRGPLDGGSDRYLALFNPGDKRRDVGIRLRDLGLSGPVAVRDLWEGKALGRQAERVSATLPPHGSALYRLG